jgi:hypothetical protein
MQRFKVAQDNLQDRGDDVVNPADICDQLPPLTHNEYMSICLPLLDLCQCIYMLKGWEKSNGATQEYEHAVKKGLKVMYE